MNSNPNACPSANVTNFSTTIPVIKEEKARNKTATDLLANNAISKSEAQILRSSLFPKSSGFVATNN